MGQPTVTFVVPCYNYGRFLPDCLRSILSQVGEWDFEIVVVDDASSDHTQDVLREFADRRMRIITHSENQGHVVTINEGLAAARGRYVARIDPDDRYRPCFLAATVEKLRQFPAVGLVYGEAALIDAEGRITEESPPRNDQRGNELVPLLMRNYICAPTVLARREAWQSALPIPAGMAFSDYYFNLQIARRNELYRVGQVLAEYRVHDANHHSTISRNKTEEGSIFRLLEEIYREEEEDPALEARKRQVRGAVYASHYEDMATKYFGLGYFRDARRCYLAALRCHRAAWVDLTLWRRLFATGLGPAGYAALKRALGGKGAPPGPTKDLGPAEDRN